MWLAENFRSFLDEWNSRTDLSPRAYGMVKLEPEIKVLTSFGKRAYTSELIEQRTIISDLFGGKLLIPSHFLSNYSVLNGYRNTEFLPTGCSPRKAFLGRQD
jgi:hypothetical protein